MSDTNRESGPATWSVHRQDDNGNRYVVASGLAESDARKLVDEYDARGHKQLYWASCEASNEDRKHFDFASSKVLKKNAELYRRLA